MSEQADTLSLKPRTYDKLGVVHCGVTRNGFISVGGERCDIADGQELVFDRVHIKVTRKGDEYTFAKTK